jgi:hypothetical protein
MSAKLLVRSVSIAEILFLVGLLLLMWNRKAIRDFPMLATFIVCRSISGVIAIAVLFFRAEIGINKTLAYDIYLDSYWPSTIIQAVLMVLLVYGIYSMALAPFEPLKKLGTIIFRWIAAISVAVSVGVALGPHMFSRSQFVNMVGQIQQTASVLTICLLLFVCFALKPLGLTFGSRAFGATMGLGILATTQLIQSAWFSQTSGVYSIVNFYSGLGACAALAVWIVYFAMPEPERSMVLLPTTSPYFFWNKISEALGDSAGFVAISGFTPDSMAPGELAAMIEASTPRVEHTASIMQPIAVNR